MTNLIRNKKGGTFAVVILILVVIFAIVIFPSVVEGEGFSFDGVIDGIIGFFNNLLGGLNGDASGYVGIGFEVFYTDGGSEEFGASPSFQIAPMSISVNGRDVDYIDIYVRAKFTAENVAVWSSDTQQQIELYKEPSTTPLYSSTGHFEKSGQDWVSGTVKELSQITINADVIQDLVEEYGGSVWNLQVNVNVDLEAKISGITQTFEGLAPSAGLQLTYSDGFAVDSLDVTTKTYPIS